MTIFRKHGYTEAGLKLCSYHRCPVIKVEPNAESVCVYEWLIQKALHHKIVDFIPREPDDDEEVIGLPAFVLDNQFLLPSLFINIRPSSSFVHIQEKIATNQVECKQIVFISQTKSMGKMFCDFYLEDEFVFQIDVSLEVLLFLLESDETQKYAGDEHVKS